MTYAASAAPEITLRLVTTALAVGTPVLIPVLVYLLWIFKLRGNALDMLEQ